MATAVAGTLLALSAPASAGGQAGSLGVGAEFQLNGLGGVSVNKDLGLFHAGGVLGFADAEGPGNTTVDLGGRFFYHLHSSPMSDFGLGGQIGLRFLDNPAPADNFWGLYIEPAMQVRAFIANNVCLSFTAGFTVGLFDAGGVVLSGQPNAGAGFHYYFF